MYRWILFDLDGTLTDPKEGIVRSIQYALEKLGIHEPHPDKLQSFIGPPLLEALRDTYHLDEQTARAALGYYRERFEERGMFENAVFPGIEELLSQLRANGGILAVATSKPTVYAKKICEHFGLAQHFAAIVGSELDGRRSNKDEVVAAAMEAVGVRDVRRAVMIGDRKFDVMGARKNGIDVVGVLYGYGSRLELESERPSALVNSVEELKTVLLGRSQPTDGRMVRERPPHGSAESDERP
jgi:phosphoglycolate phosphatase